MRLERRSLDFCVRSALSDAWRLDGVRWYERPWAGYLVAPVAGLAVGLFYWVRGFPVPNEETPR